MTATVSGGKSSSEQLMNTRSLIKAHRLALTVINFPVLLHWQPAISATDSQLPTAAEAAAAMGEKKGRRICSFPSVPLCWGEAVACLELCTHPKAETKLGYLALEALPVKKGHTLRTAIK